MCHGQEEPWPETSSRSAVVRRAAPDRTHARNMHWRNSLSLAEAQGLGEKYKPAIHLVAFISNGQINTSHFKTDPSLCRQTQRLSQQLNECSMKSPQKEHTNGKLQIQHPPKLLYFLIKLLSHSKHIGLKKQEINVSGTSQVCRRATLSDARKW